MYRLVELHLSLLFWCIILLTAVWSSTVPSPAHRLELLPDLRTENLREAEKRMDRGKRCKRMNERGRRREEGGGCKFTTKKHRQL